MKEVVSNQPRMLVIRHHLGVDLLCDLNAARRLAPFMREEQTLGSAAHELEMPSSSLAYWVSRFRRAGLVEIVRHQARAGKPIPVYRATADEFRVPLDAMPPGAQDEFLMSGRRRLFEQFTESVNIAAWPWYQQGLRLRPQPDGGMELGFVEPERADSPPVTEFWGGLRLSDDDAAELRREMEALMARYTNDRTGPGKRRYIVVVGIAPQARRRRQV
jgi:hypothetical protein